MSLAVKLSDVIRAFQEASGLRPAGGTDAVTPAHVRAEIEALRRRVAALERENKKLRSRTPNRKGVKVRAAGAGGATAADHQALNKAVRREQDCTARRGPLTG